MSDIVQPTLWRLPLATSLGVFSVEISPYGVSRLQFPSDFRTPGSALRQTLPSEARQWHVTTLKALRALLRGSPPRALPPLDWAGATPFQCSVWKALLRIPQGRTASYGEVARRIGSPHSARAVGTACGANPIPVLVPCHRVIASDGGLGGFSGGLDIKRRLLRIEGVTVAA